MHLLSLSPPLSLALPHSLLARALKHVLLYDFQQFNHCFASRHFCQSTPQSGQSLYRCDFAFLDAPSHLYKRS